MYDALQEVWSELTARGAPFEIEDVRVGGRPLRAYKNAPPTLRAVWQQTAQHAASDYLVYDDERWTYARAGREVASIAHWLFDRGVEPGDRVAIAMRNYPEWLLSYWACVSVGITAVGMNAWWTGPELAHGVEDSDPRVILADRERLERLIAQPDLVAGRTLVGVRDDSGQDSGGDGVVPFSQLLDSGDELPEVEVSPEDDACIFYTSGTTGRPKGAQLTHRGCVSNIMSMAFANTVQPAALARNAEKRASEGSASSPTSAPEEECSASTTSPAALVVTPLFHVTANNCVAHGMTVAGGKLVLMYKWEPAEALRLIEAEGVTAMSGVPVMARELLAHADFEKRDTSTLKTLGGGGAQLQPDLVKRIDDRVRTARPNTGYGMTETCGIITSVAADFFVDRPDSCGRAMPCFETRIVDSDGNVRADGEVGELCVRSAQVIKGYLNRPEATAEAIEDGWLRTGDIAKIDADGFIYIVDRAKDMVLRGGENIYCAEVEAALFSHDAVTECSVFGVPDDRLGEEVGAAIFSSNTSADEARGRARPVASADLRAYLAGRLAGFKIPRYIWWLDEPLPRNASGKFLKRELREELDPKDAG